MIGLVTIGQTPRNDVALSMFGKQHSALSIQTGALNSLDANQVRDLAPRLGESVLVTQLADGREVSLAKQRLTPYLQTAIDRADEAGATSVCVLCTGEFTGLRSRTRLVFPDSVLRGVVDALLPEGTLGVMMPHLDQEATMIEKWSRQSRHPIVETASPYSAAEAIDDVSNRLESAGAEMIIMDCMGYTREMHTNARAGVTIPVILSNSLVGAVLAETGSVPRTVEHVS